MLFCASGFVLHLFLQTTGDSQNFKPRRRGGRGRGLYCPFCRCLLNCKFFQRQWFGDKKDKNVVKFGTKFYFSSNLKVRNTWLSKSMFSPSQHYLQSLCLNDQFQKVSFQDTWSFIMYSTYIFSWIVICTSRKPVHRTGIQRVHHFEKASLHRCYGNV